MLQNEVRCYSDLSLSPLSVTKGRIASALPPRSLIDSGRRGFAAVSTNQRVQWAWRPAPRANPHVVPAVSSPLVHCSAREQDVCLSAPKPKKNSLNNSSQPAQQGIIPPT
ncbi:hypothetical protein JTE90_024359 [Oedothorax gibbosus]|uniref:Uncharacterized protein n=1 Tax=Oedothorax gibbosus TaxID=931172 RepID=A0AAV6VWX4_9ARAC|nr:hypothetical protein JTE90_024359 [Oedothorax gibbosus]